MGEHAQAAPHRALRVELHNELYSTSMSSWDLRDSSSRLSLIHSLSLRRSFLTGGFLASGMCAAPTRAYGSKPPAPLRSTVSLAVSPRAGVDSMDSGARSSGTPAQPASIHSTRALPRSSCTICDTRRRLLAWCGL